MGQTVMVPVESNHPAHANMFKTLALLRLYDREGSPVYFVVESCAIHELGEALDQSYLYDEHTCPTNYISVEAVMTSNDDDPHGIFDYVRSVWMPVDYEAAEEDDRNGIIHSLFPEISAPAPHKPE